MKESKSKNINLTFQVMEDLDEFFVSESSQSEDEEKGYYQGPSMKKRDEKR